MLHFFKEPISHIPLPEKFTYPFHYTPHPLCVMAAEEVKAYISMREDWKEELTSGKMFGVLLVQNSQNTKEVGYLAAFSGNLAGKNLHPFFVPPIYDLLHPEGFFRIEEEQISAINNRITTLERTESYIELSKRLKAETNQACQELARAKEELKEAKENREFRRRSDILLSEAEQAALVRESQFQKAEFKRLERSWKQRLEELENELNQFRTEIGMLKKERKTRSAALQQQLFEQFRMLNGKGEVKDLCSIFEQTVHKTPPSGAGECALPKLLQYAFLHHLKLLAMAEFWWGNSPKNEIRTHGYYYPSCKGKCEPILQHMLQGLEVDANPLSDNRHKDTELEVIFEDDWLLVVNKPAGMLSVPGKEAHIDSIYERLRKQYPLATGPMIVHRLDMATSGLLLVAKTKEVHQALQAQFENRTIKKRYIALLDGEVERPETSGRIELPICLNPLDRPRQMVSEVHGKPAVTDYRILEITGGRTRVAFYPVTGRTHQLRVHAAHLQGLACPISGDELYGQKADRLYLHAEFLEFRHPIHKQIVCVQKEADF